MSIFNLHTHELRRKGRNPCCKGSRMHGFVPIGHPASTLKAYMTISGIFDESSFTLANAR